MNKKGFTLVELIATISILAIISTITLVSVEKVLKKSNDDATTFQDEMIEVAAKSYANDNLAECKDECIVKIESLEEYLDNYDNVKDKYRCVKVERNNKRFKTTIINDESICNP